MLVARLSWHSCSRSGRSLGLASAPGLAAPAPRGRGGGRLPGCAASCSASAVSRCQPGSRCSVRCAACSGLRHGPRSMRPRCQAAKALTRCLPLQDVLKSKNTAIEDLQFQLARVCKVRKGSGHAV